MLEEAKMGRKRRSELQVVHPDCAGIDIGSSAHYVAVDPTRSDEPVRCFGSFTDELEAMGRWLRECGVDIVAIESTGVYWIPVYEVLERFGFEVHLVDPRATKQVSGRKSDVLDCQWIRQLMTHGLLSGAFLRAVSQFDGLIFTIDDGPSTTMAAASRPRPRWDDQNDGSRGNDI